MTDARPSLYNLPHLLHALPCTASGQSEITWDLRQIPLLLGESVIIQPEGLNLKSIKVQSNFSVKGNFLYICCLQ